MRQDTSSDVSPRIVHIPKVFSFIHNKTKNSILHAKSSKKTKKSRMIHHQNKCKRQNQISRRTGNIGPKSIQYSCTQASQQIKIPQAKENKAARPKYPYKTANSPFFSHSWCKAASV